jgi:hypothetical protein
VSTTVVPPTTSRPAATTSAPGATTPSAPRRGAVAAGNGYHRDADRKRPPHTDAPTDAAPAAPRRTRSPTR